MFLYMGVFLNSLYDFLELAVLGNELSPWVIEAEARELSPVDGLLRQKRENCPQWMEI
jgi:hypothetical protein